MGCERPRGEGVAIGLASALKECWHRNAILSASSSHLGRDTFLNATHCTAQIFAPDSSHFSSFAFTSDGLWLAIGSHRGFIYFVGLSTLVASYTVDTSDPDQPRDLSVEVIASYPTKQRHPRDEGRDTRQAYLGMVGEGSYIFVQKQEACGQQGDNLLQCAGDYTASPSVLGLSFFGSNRFLTCQARGFLLVHELLSDCCDANRAVQKCQAQGQDRPVREVFRFPMATIKTACQHRLSALHYDSHPAWSQDGEWHGCTVTWHVLRISMAEPDAYVRSLDLVICFDKTTSAPYSLPPFYCRLERQFTHDAVQLTVQPLLTAEDLGGEGSTRTGHTPPSKSQAKGVPQGVARLSQTSRICVFTQKYFACQSSIKVQYTSPFEGLQRPLSPFPSPPPASYCEETATSIQRHEAARTVIRDGADSQDGVVDLSSVGEAGAEDVPIYCATFAATPPRIIVLALHSPERFEIVTQIRLPGTASSNIQTIGLVADLQGSQILCRLSGSLVLIQLPHFGSSPFAAAEVHLVYSNAVQKERIEDACLTHAPSAPPGILCLATQPSPRVLFLTRGGVGLQNLIQHMELSQAGHLSHLQWRPGHVSWAALSPRDGCLYLFTNPAHPHVWGLMIPGFEILERNREIIETEEEFDNLQATHCEEKESKEVLSPAIRGPWFSSVILTPVQPRLLGSPYPADLDTEPLRSIREEGSEGLLWLQPCDAEMLDEVPEVLRAAFAASIRSAVHDTAELSHGTNDSQP